MGERREERKITQGGKRKENREEGNRSCSVRGRKQAEDITERTALKINVNGAQEHSTRVI